ncbi:MFS transporter [Actinoplanes sp. NPDC049265]|uniref:MFS transporter n=1 Tax=Actinoplanes sp. NPDC049265 TaxID=3363902 RepID=UPI00371CF15B
MALGPDFRRLWAAYSISELGSGVAIGALPLVATIALNVPTIQVSLLSALSGVAGALLALPLGPWVEFRRKRPIMVGSDLARFVVLVSVPVAAAFGMLTYAQLCVVAMVQAVGVIVFNAASGAHLKALVPAEWRGEANARLEMTLWTVYSAGPPLGGVLVSAAGATASMAADAVSFLLSALGIRRLRAAEPPPPPRHPAPRLHELTAGWRYILGHRALRALWLNSLVFGACVMATAPLLAVLMLRELRLTPFEYGIAMGVPCLGGILGAFVARRLPDERGKLLGFGVGRTLFMILLAVAPAGLGGLLVITVSQFLLILCAGAFNPTFTTYRMRVTDDGNMSRVLSAWSISQRVAQPIGIVAGGVLATLTSTRVSLAILSGVLLTSVFLLPWRSFSRRRAARPEPLPVRPG